MKKFKKILGILAAVVVVIMIGSNIKLTTVQTHKQEQKQLQEEQLSGDGIQEEIIEMTEPQMQIGEEQTKEEPAKQEKNKKKKTEHISDKKANGEEKKTDTAKIKEKRGRTVLFFCNFYKKLKYGFVFAATQLFGKIQNIFNHIYGKHTYYYNNSKSVCFD